ncbi:MAG: 23S rRNA (adenine(2503)-C(2))-methyltransferase RlmN [Flavobacteriales bacterium CG18_big_fil_WC_8_21_14_2_50_32_9]|nr:MAG: 23S rRNA (adenine(2503)-C(2))-methyltransferase RlmN [Flavobacteriales bacterium CG18_big_fil_WC_8_21_14_2_50_32_9]PJC62605.1 MAG: 23S rRNA (adenine(2503)-C(2))-methyltransferase RlmN [Flavobacteriales bacterium CG_4_9_14_0_2_um_filter_32_27]
MKAKQNIRHLSKEEIIEFFKAKGEQAFRAKQVYEWLWKKHATTFDKMTNLSFPTRELLKDNFVINAITTIEEQVSSDRTIKNAFKLHDGSIIEGVLIPTPKRMTACISSQVGCSLTCTFCATGKLDRLRNIDADEIFDQVALIKKQAEEKYKTPLTNIVYMGMGEPLLNYKNVLDSIEKITNEDGLAMSPKRITVSTAGIAKMIKKLGDDGVKFNLALSLHAANDEKRSKIMPINEQNSLESLKEAIIYFHEKTGTRVSFEYIIFKDFNDSLEDAKELADFCKIVPCKINIIEYNPIDGAHFKKADTKKTDEFARYLEDKCRLVVNVRRSRGKDIDAACGQLANKKKAVLKKL